MPAAAVLTQVRVRSCRVVRFPSSNGSQEDGHEGCCQAREAPDHKRQAHGRRGGETNRRKNQANMVTQVKNAHDKLLKRQKGEIAVSDKEQEDLQVKAGFYARYITLDRFAPEKLDMLESFMNDKTCNSWLQREKSTASVSSTMGGSNEGWVSRFEIAKEEGLPAGHPVLKAMLLKLPQDDDWDVAIPREAAMKEAGEKRFWYCRKVMTEIRGGVTEKDDGVQGGGDFKKPLALGFLGQESAKRKGVRRDRQGRVPQVAYAAGALESAPDW